MNALSYIRLHLELECKGIDSNNQLIRLDCPNPDTFTRVYLARYAGGESLFFAAGLSERIRTQLLQKPAEVFFERPEEIKAFLAEDAPCEEVHIGSSYLFPDGLNSADFPHVVRLSQLSAALVRAYDPGIDLGRREVFGVLADGRIVSTCESSRENDSAGEAWVRTLEPYQRRGYARQVTAAWGCWLQAQGKVPFYSHKRENLASQAVARSLGLIRYIEDAGYA